MEKMILIVDDEERILFVLEHALRKLDDGLKVETASTGEDGLRRVGEHSYDLIISDLIMPDMDGVAFTEKIRDLSSEVAVVWMTAYGCKSFQAEAERLGVYCCVEKPLEINQVRELAREAMASDEEPVSEGQGAMS